MTGATATIALDGHRRTPDYPGPGGKKFLMVSGHAELHGKVPALHLPLLDGSKRSEMYESRSG